MSLKGEGVKVLLHIYMDIYLQILLKDHERTHTILALTIPCQRQNYLVSF